MKNQITKTDNKSGKKKPKRTKQSESNEESGTSEY
jgi:hypothetical protein